MINRRTFIKCLLVSTTVMAIADPLTLAFDKGNSIKVIDVYEKGTFSYYGAKGRYIRTGNIGEDVHVHMRVQANLLTRAKLIMGLPFTPKTRPVVYVHRQGNKEFYQITYRTNNTEKKIMGVVPT